MLPPPPLPLGGGGGGGGGGEGTIGSYDTNITGGSRHTALHQNIVDLYYGRCYFVCGFWHGADIVDMRV